MVFLKFLVISMCFLSTLSSDTGIQYNGKEYNIRTINKENIKYCLLTDLLKIYDVKPVYNRILHKLVFKYMDHVFAFSPLTNMVNIDYKSWSVYNPIIFEEGNFYISFSVLNNILPEYFNYLIHKDLIVIDPGHGGPDDTGTSCNGIMEKDLVLRFSFILGKILKQKGYDVVYTREKDLPLELKDRIDRANNEKAKLFISVHINWSDAVKAQGVEVYYLTEKTSDTHSNIVAMAENKVFRKNVKDNTEIGNIVKSMFFTGHIKESSTLAGDIASKIPIELNRGVKKAPFYVLAGTYMPSVLLELGFLSNESDFKNLKSDSYLKDLAQKVSEGVFLYMNSKKGVVKYEG